MLERSSLSRFLGCAVAALAAGCAGVAAPGTTTAGSANVPPATGASSIAQRASAGLVRHVAMRVPVQGPARELAAMRPAEQPSRVAPQAPKKAKWTLLATLHGAVIHDIAFPSQSVGFAAAELGQVWKTTNGGSSWTEILNLGFPYYWYGVAALDTNNVVISGFNDQTEQGIISWTSDGGSTWSSNVVLTNYGWSDRVRFINSNTGLVLDQLSTQSANAAHYTTDGGQSASDWTQVTVDPNGGWFGSEFALLGDRSAWASGITYCASGNAGQTWSCGPSVDSVFDGPVFFADDLNGWDGGGEISPNVAGWVHRTIDGGKTWSGRVLNSPWPIRELYFISSKKGWAAGGNIYSDVGGIYYSHNGGKTWTQELDTGGAEMDACASQPAGKRTQVWCAGYTSSLNGVVYTTKR